MAEKELELTTEKKSNKKKLLGVIIVLSVLNTAVKAYAEYRRKRAEQKEAATKDSSYKVFEVFGNGKNVEIKEAFAGADIRCTLGGVCIDLSHAELEQEVYIDLHTVLGGVEMKIPAGVNVSYEGSCLLGGIAKPAAEYEGEDVRTIHITGKTLLGGVAIQMMEEESDIVEDYFEEGSFGKEREKFI